MSMQFERYPERVRPDRDDAPLTAREVYRRAFRYGGITPGVGQIILGRRWEGGIFAGLCLAAWIGIAFAFIPVSIALPVLVLTLVIGHARLFVLLRDH
jgi:hypothetical protein